jgi:hypothetical protein
VFKFLSDALSRSPVSDLPQVPLALPGIAYGISICTRANVFLRVWTNQTTATSSKRAFQKLTVNLDGRLSSNEGASKIQAVCPMQQTRIQVQAQQKLVNLRSLQNGCWWIGLFEMELRAQQNIDPNTPHAEL